VITAYATFDTAVEAIKRGAVDYLPKPFSPAQIRTSSTGPARKAIEYRVVNLQGSSPTRLQRLSRDRVAQDALDARSHRPGSDLGRAHSSLRGKRYGKGVLARAAHAQSKRSKRPFVTVNCPTLSEELLASELFGHTKGAFTGAVPTRRTGGSRRRGTIFLDEIVRSLPGFRRNCCAFCRKSNLSAWATNRTRRADVG